MLRRSSWPSRMALVWLSGLVASCGGSSSTSPNPVPSASPGTTRTVIVDNVPFNLPPGAATFKNVDNVPAGVVDATLNWAGPNDINLYATDSSCTGLQDLLAGRCNLLARADSTTARPEHLTFNSTAGRTYSLWIHNHGTSAESGTLEVGVTRPNDPNPVPTPTPGNPNDPRAGLAPGPVVRYTIKVRSIDTGNFNYRDPTQDPSTGNWIVHPDEFVVFDSTQKNAAGDVCVWINDPVWTVDDPDGVLRVRGSSNPFLLRTDVLRRGVLRIQSVIDGVESNTLVVESTRR